MSNIQGMSGVGPLAGTDGVLPPQMSISEILLMIGIQAMDANDDKIRIAYAKVQQNNKDLQDLNKVLACLAANKGRDLDPQTDIGGGLTLGDALKRFGITPELKDGKLDNTKFEALQKQVQNASDALGGTNQIDMMKLQSTLNKQNEMSQMVSNNMSKLNQMAMALIGNMR